MDMCLPASPLSCRLEALCLVLRRLVGPLPALDGAVYGGRAVAAGGCVWQAGRVPDRPGWPGHRLLICGRYCDQCAVVASCYSFTAAGEVFWGSRGGVGCCALCGGSSLQARQRCVLYAVCNSNTTSFGRLRGPWPTGWAKCWAGRVTLAHRCALVPVYPHMQEG